MTLWVDALKEWNQGKSGWCVPRKGTTEYTQVMQIVDRLKPREMPKPRNLEPVFNKIRVRKPRY